ncbi:MAG: hypothetical protein IT262_02005 [Saprospiraceae bacterium]|nr:hypothetical protein [Saprospiraceae bacterium]
MLRKIFIFTFLLSAQWLTAQESAKCQDVVYLKGGSVFRGTITRYDRSGMLEIETWSGTKMLIPSNTVRRVVQKCYGSGKERKERGYTFIEQGWYHNTRVAMLFGDVENGYSLQHSSGIKMNRFLSVGLGTGVENYGPGGNTPVTIPLFLEIRGYLTKQRIAPFYALGGGWSTIGRTQRNIDWWGWENNIENWKGGWMAQGQVGYRIGNHFTTFIGIRLQRLNLDWDNNAWGGGFGTDKHLKKRVEFGLGLLL